MCHQTSPEAGVNLGKCGHIVPRRFGPDHMLVQVLLGDHDIPNEVGVPFGLLHLLNEGLGEDVVEVLAGGLSQPGVVDLCRSVVTQVLRALSR